MNLRDMALSIIGRSPQVAQGPNARHMLGVIQSGDAKEGERMRQSTTEHMADTMATLREMWDDADPDLRKRMKADLTKLTQEME